MNTRVTSLKARYVEMMETVAESQKGLLDEAESRRKRLKRDRTLDSLLMGLFCFWRCASGFARLVGYSDVCKVVRSRAA